MIVDKPWSYEAVSAHNGRYFGEVLHVQQRRVIVPGMKHRITAIEAHDVMEVSMPEVDDVVR
jgi:hypothetical protein